MGSSAISTLPPEVLHQVLKYLPIATLLRFARTSKRNYSAAILALQHLRLAILPRHIHGVLAFLSSSTFDDIDSDAGDSAYDNPERNQIIVPSPLPPLSGPSRSKRKPPATLPPTPAHYREKLFQLQNALACSILSTPTLASLGSLTLHLYHITSPSLTEILATLFPCLRDLHLNFHHPYLHDTCLPAQYWTNPVYLQPSSIWNALAGVGDKSNSNLRLRKLEKLTVERAGITSFQLRKWIESNPNLRELRLRNVAGVDQEFVQWLGSYYGSSRLEKNETARPTILKTLALESCAALEADSSEELSWLDSLFDTGSIGVHGQDSPSVLHCLSLRYSSAVKTTALCTYLESNRPAIQRVTLPDGCILAPKRPKRSRSKLSTEYSRSPCPSNCKKRPRTGTIQASSRDQGDAPIRDDHVTVSETVEMGIQALSIDEGINVCDESSEDEDTASQSPVSYLRVINHHRPRKSCKFTPSDFIEPDPDAI